MPSQLDEFVRSAREFLDANAEPRGGGPEIEWGSGADRIAYFSADPPEVAQQKVQAARAWQRRRYEAGFGWISGPEEYGGAGLSTVHDLAYAGLEAEYAVPDTGVLAVIGLGMIGPTILAHGDPGDQGSGTCRPCTAATPSPASCSASPAPGPTSRRRRPAPCATATTWVLNGQKVWTSIAQHADIGMALTPHQPGRAQAPGHHRLPGPHGRPGRRGPAAAPDDRRRGVQRGLPHRRPRPRRPPTRRGRRRLAGRADHPDERAGHRRQRSIRRRWPTRSPCRPRRPDAGQRTPATTPRCAASSPNCCVDVRPRPSTSTPAQRKLRAGGTPARRCRCPS